MTYTGKKEELNKKLAKYNLSIGEIVKTKIGGKENFGTVVGVEHAGPIIQRDDIGGWTNAGAKENIVEGTVLTKEKGGWYVSITTENLDGIEKIPTLAGLKVGDVLELASSGKYVVAGFDKHGLPYDSSNILITQDPWLRNWKSINGVSIEHRRTKEVEVKPPIRNLRVGSRISLGPNPIESYTVSSFSEDGYPRYKTPSGGEFVLLSDTEFDDNVYAIDDNMTVLGKMLEEKSRRLKVLKTDRSKYQIARHDKITHNNGIEYVVVEDRLYNGRVSCYDPLDMNLIPQIRRTCTIAETSIQKLNGTPYMRAVKPIRGLKVGDVLSSEYSGGSWTISSFDKEGNPMYGDGDREGRIIDEVDFDRNIDAVNGVFTEVANKKREAERAQKVDHYSAEDRAKYTFGLMPGDIFVCTAGGYWQVERGQLIGSSEPIEYFSRQQAHLALGSRRSSHLTDDKVIAKLNGKTYISTNHKLPESLWGLKIGDILTGVNGDKVQVGAFNADGFPKSHANSIGIFTFSDPATSGYYTHINGVMTEKGKSIARSKAKFGIIKGDVLRMNSGGTFTVVSDVPFDSSADPGVARDNCPTLRFNNVDGIIAINGKPYVQPAKAMPRSEAKPDKPAVVVVEEKSKNANTELKHIFNIYNRRIDNDKILNPPSKFRQEINSVAYRVAAKQAITLSKNAIISLLRSQGKDNETIIKMTSLLDTEFGRTLISMSFGVGLSQLPAENFRAQKLATECRVQSLTTLGNSISDAVIESLIDVLRHEETLEEEGGDLEEYVEENQMPLSIAR